jgi:hypothetical protein
VAVRVVGLALLVALAPAVAQARPVSQPAVLVSFHQLGGFAGIERGLVVYRTGKVESDGFPLSTARLTAARLQSLRTALQQARFATLPRKYESDEPVADGYVYRISYAGRTVRVEEGATLPQRLRRPFSLLLGLVRE